MVAQVATEDRALAAVVSFYGVYDIGAMVSDASPRSLLARLFGRTTLDPEARALMRTASPLYRVHRGMPPLLLVHGTNERLWEQGVAMAGALKQAGVPSELVRLDGAPHGMGSWEGRPEWAGYKPRVVGWLRARFAALAAPRAAGGPERRRFAHMLPAGARPSAGRVISGVSWIFANKVSDHHRRQAHRPRSSRASSRGAAPTWCCRIAARRTRRCTPSADVEALGRRATTVVADVAKPADCAAIVDHAVQTFGRLDVLVNMASIYR